MLDIEGLLVKLIDHLLDSKVVNYAAVVGISEIEASVDHAAFIKVNGEDCVLDSAR